MSLQLAPLLVGAWLGMGRAALACIWEYSGPWAVGPVATRGQCWPLAALTREGDSGCERAVCPHCVGPAPRTSLPQAKALRRGQARPRLLGACGAGVALSRVSGAACGMKEGGFGKEGGVGTAGLAFPPCGWEPQARWGCRACWKAAVPCFLAGTVGAGCSVGALGLPSAGELVSAWFPNPPGGSAERGL